MREQEYGTYAVKDFYEAENELQSTGEVWKASDLGVSVLTRMQHGTTIVKD